MVRGIHRLFIIISTAICVSGLIYTPCLADSFFPEHEIQEIEQCVNDQSNYYNTVLTSLEVIPIDEWTIEQHYEYINAALWTVYYGMNYYFKENGSLPDNLMGLADSNYIPTWPVNPYNNWEPIRILTLADGFSPGDMTFQICPHEFWSYVRNTRPISCELSVFGPDLAFGEYGDAEPMEANTWAVVPEGAVLMVGQHAEPASVLHSRIEQAVGEEDQNS